MKTRMIYKYTIELVASQKVIFPREHKIIHVAFQHENICLWAEVEVDMEATVQGVVKGIEIRGTGHEFDGLEGRYIGSVLQDEGNFVWHVYERLEDSNANL